MFRTSFRRVGSRKGRHAFTLVELLVVVAIIALLVSILLPTLNKAKEQARAVVCMTNLKSIALATQLYNHSYNNWIHAAYCPIHYKTWDQAMIALDLLPEVDELNALSFCPTRITPRWDGPYYSYGQRMAIHDYCPPGGGFVRTYGWFSLSGSHVRCVRAGPDNDFHYPFTPGEFVLHADTLSFSYDYTERYQYYAFKDSMTTATPSGYNFIEMRHANKVNCGFADSHVEGLGRTELNNRGFDDEYLWPPAPTP